MTLTPTTRPAGIGGIDLSGVDVAAAIFTATGGDYGAPRDSTPIAGGTPTKLPDWMTNFGEGKLVDAFDFDQAPPADRDAPIKLLAEPEGSHPLIDLFLGDSEPQFANGGPEGTGWVVPVAAAAIIVVALWAVDDLSGGAVCKALGWKHDGYTDPDAMTGTMQSPAEFLASLLGTSDLQGIDTGSVKIADLLGLLSDNMGKVAELVGGLKGAAEAGDNAGFGNALADLMKLAGLDAGAFNFASVSPQGIVDGVFDAFGIVGGLEGVTNMETLQDLGNLWAITEATLDLTTWVTAWRDDIA